MLFWHYVVFTLFFLYKTESEGITQDISDFDILFAVSYGY